MNLWKHPKMNNKMMPIPNYGDLMLIQDFIECVQTQLFSPDDGVGYYATEKEYDEKACVWAVKSPVWATHVIWFNK
jgi:hypothetical protein